MKRKIKVAAIQTNTNPAKLESNLDISLKLASKAIKNGAQLVVFSELFDSGYCVNDKDFANDFSKQDSKTFITLLKFAKKHDVYLVGCVIEKENDNFYDTAFIIGKDGLVGKYRKIYLWGDEVKRFKRGSEYPVFELDFGAFKAKVGLQICYEIGFGEGARILSLKGAEIIICPAAFGKARAYVWNLASRARALENGAFIIAVNHSKSECVDGKKIEFCGDSQIINPKGKILTKAEKACCYIQAVLNLDKVVTQRNAIPYLKDLNLALEIQQFQSLQALEST